MARLRNRHIRAYRLFLSPYGYPNTEHPICRILSRSETARYRFVPGRGGIAVESPELSEIRD